MGISDRLLDAIESTPYWSIYFLTEKEKEDWRVFGIDQLEQHLQINAIADKRFISQAEFTHIFSSNYEDCLDQARKLKQTVFECAEKRNLKPLPLHIRTAAHINHWLDSILAEPSPKRSHPEVIADLKNKIIKREIYERHMGIDNINQPENAITADQPMPSTVAQQIEEKNVWWVDGKYLSIFIANPSHQPIKSLIFSLSMATCGERSDTRSLRMTLLAPLEGNEQAIYSGKLPFNYQKIYGKGMKCGIILQAFG